MKAQQLVLAVLLASAAATSIEVFAQDKNMPQSTTTVRLPVEGQLPSFAGAIA